MPETTWAVPQLELGPGRPCGLWGYGGSGKTYIAQDIALSIASGEKVFGAIDCARGKVAHISHELGLRVTKERYRRLGNGRLIDPTEVDMIVSAYPKIYLNSQHAEEWYLRELEGCALVVLDSLRRALPGEDENDSAISNFLDILARVSEKLSCTFLVLHHEGKGATRDQGPGEKRDQRGTGRGSSAIEDGSGCIWRVEGSGRGPRRLIQSRAHDDGDGEAQDIWIDLINVAVPEPPYEARKPPWRIALLEEAEIATRERAGRRKANLAAYAARCGEIVAAVEAGLTTQRKILAAVKDSRANRDTIRELVEVGVLDQGSTRNGDAATYRIGSVTLEQHLTPPAKPDGWEGDFDAG